jgi:hypothetical protein
MERRRVNPPEVGKSAPLLTDRTATKKAGRPLAEIGKSYRHPLPSSSATKNQLRFSFPYVYCEIYTDVSIWHTVVNYGI